MRKTPEMSIVIRRSPCDLIDPDSIKQAFRCLFGKTSFVRIMGFYGSGSVKTLPVLLLYYRL